MNLKQGTITEPRHYTSNSRRELEVASLFSIYRNLLLLKQKMTLGLIYPEYLKLDGNFTWRKMTKRNQLQRPGVSQVVNQRQKWTTAPRIKQNKKLGEAD